MNLNCIPCGKTFTGEACYQQHVLSEKHKKKARLELLVTDCKPNALDLPSVGELFACNICNISFGTLPNYKKHVESLEHAKNLMKRDAGKDDSEEKIAIPTEGSDENDSSLIEMQDDNNRLVNLQESVSQKLCYKSCDMCNKTFSGPEPYNQHLASIGHAKKLAQNSSMNLIKRDTNKNDSEENVAIDDNYSNSVEMQDDDRLINLQECVNQKLYYKTCDICNKKFCGPEPYNQHLASIGHRKKLAQNSSKVGDLTPESCSPENPRTSAVVRLGFNQLVCEVCDKTFSGPVPHDQHMKSEVHKKKVERVHFFGSGHKRNSLNENVSRENAIDSTTDEEEKPLNVQQNNLTPAEYSSSKIDNKINTANGDLEDTLPDSPVNISDLILPSIENLDVITAVQLNVRFFDVDSEINFDEGKPDESEMEIETELIQKCDLCNIFLKNIDDLKKHYESKEHFLKKWSK